jgi:hypothetical protein
MLAIMHEATPRGSLLVNGRQITFPQLASLSGASPEEVSAKLEELRDAAVFSVEADGTIYSRRMRRDEAKTIENKNNGAKGGNPFLTGNSTEPDKEGVNPGVNPPVYGGDKAQKPEARDQRLEARNHLPENNSASRSSAPDEPAVEPPTKKLVARSEGDQALLDRVTDIWNAWAAAHGSPQVNRLTAKRGVHCRRRIQDLMDYGPSSPEEAFKFLLSKCDQSFFARGSPRTPLKFDQLMREDFMTQMLEGAFEHRPNQQTNGTRRWVS